MTRTEAVVLAGHGSQRHAESAAPLHAHAERIRLRGLFDEVRTAFWKEEPALWDLRSVVESDVAYVVPVLTSEGYFADEVFPRELGVGTPDGDEHDGPELHYAAPVGTHDAMTDVVVDRIESTIQGPPGEVGVALVGHGTERNERSAEATERHAGKLREEGRYAEVVALFLDEEPNVGDLFDYVDATEIVVLPLFVADGYHTTRDVPAAIGHPGVGESATIDGRLVHYAGAVGTEPSLADVVVERAIEAGASTGRDEMRRGALSDADAAFAAWVDVSPSGREWGELAIDATTEGYHIRHRDDGATAAESLDSIDGAVALREHVRYDDRGRYRPLTGAHSLPTGWTLTAGNEVELARSVRSVYPGSIEHWHRARSGVLDPTNFDETVARQTGLYADLDHLDGDELAAATEAVCGSCVRERRWSVGDGVPEESRDRNEIPCREACPFLLSASHAFLESGGEAAAEPSPDVPGGVLENPANEYRVRYARALAERRDSEFTALATDGGDR